MSLTISTFFQYYLLHPQKASPQKSKLIAMISSIAFGIISCGVAHMLCYALFYDRKFSVKKATEAAEEKTAATFEKTLAPPPVEEEAGTEEKEQLLSLLEGLIDNPVAAAIPSEKSPLEDTLPKTFPEEPPAAQNPSEKEVHFALSEGTDAEKEAALLPTQQENRKKPAPSRRHTVEGLHLLVKSESLEEKQQLQKHSIKRSVSQRETKVSVTADKDKPQLVAADEHKKGPSLFRWFSKRNLQPEEQKTEETDNILKRTFSQRRMTPPPEKPSAEEQELRSKALDGDIPSQLTLGYHYLEGRNGYFKSATEAAYWFRKAADNKNPDALYRLGKLHLKGEGVEKSKQKGIEQIQEASSLGLERAKKFLKSFKGKRIQHSLEK